IHLPLGSYSVVQVDFSFKPGQKLEVKVPFLGWIDVSQFVNLGQFNQFIPETEGIYFLSPQHSGPIAVFNRNTITKRLESGLISSLAINATNENIQKITFAVYPNPAGEYIEIRDFNLKYTDIIIIDSNGKVVKSLKTTNDKQINVKDLHPGVYYLNIFNNNRQIGFSKWIKM
ncbi:MAG TPA: T9SS type A sorting domain-containing protein, partial [Saprospiraceae bacterium]|nr:T9SS type A sorting domain-containing protein [Saprospiraceae bacterium]